MCDLEQVTRRTSLRICLDEKVSTFNYDMPRYAIAC